MPSCMASITLTSGPARMSSTVSALLPAPWQHKNYIPMWFGATKRLVRQTTIPGASIQASLPCTIETESTKENPGGYKEMSSILADQ
jgi:hypothetical protein